MKRKGAVMSDHFYKCQSCKFCVPEHEIFREPDGTFCKFCVFKRDQHDYQTIKDLQFNNKRDF